jgi:hypothetical protein
MWRRVLWFAGLWLGGVLAVGSVAVVLKIAMRAASTG